MKIFALDFFGNQEFYIFVLSNKVIMKTLLETTREAMNEFNKKSNEFDAWFKELEKKHKKK